MEKVFFHPWIGDNYCTRGIFQTRILVLGESYYEKDPKEPLPPTFTNDIIKAQIQGKGPSERSTTRFYNRIARIFLGPDAPLTLAVKQKFWHSIAHYTFVQAPVGNKPSIPPTPELWLNGQDPFQYILQKYNPKLIIVLGYRLWKNLPPPVESGHLNVGEMREETRKYSTGEGDHALACRIKHPSSRGFKSKHWHPLIVEAIKLAGSTLC